MVIEVSRWSAMPSSSEAGRVVGLVHDPVLDVPDALDLDPHDVAPHEEARRAHRHADAPPRARGDPVAPPERGGGGEKLDQRERGENGTRGRWIGSYGPVTHVDCLLKKVGSSGRSAPDSAT